MRWLPCLNLRFTLRNFGRRAYSLPDEITILSNSILHKYSRKTILPAIEELINFEQHKHFSQKKLLQIVAILNVVTWKWGVRETVALTLHFELDLQSEGVGNRDKIPRTRHLPFAIGIVFICVTFNDVFVESFSRHASVSKNQIAKPYNQKSMRCMKLKR